MSDKNITERMNEAVISALLVVVVLVTLVTFNLLGLTPEKLAIFKELIPLVALITAVLGFVGGWRFIGEFFGIFFGWRPTDFSFFTSFFWLIVIVSFGYLIYIYA